MPGEAARDPRRYHSVRYALAFAGLFWISVIIAFFAASGIAQRWSGLAEEWSGGRPWLHAAIFLGLFQLVLFLVQLPLAYFRSFVWENMHGLSNEKFTRWFADAWKGFFVGTVLWIGAAEVLLAVVRKYPESWWFPVWIAWTILTVAATRVLPGWLIPMFYPLKSLPEGELKDRLKGLIARLNMRVKDIHEIALSRKTRKANAAVVGIGGGRRIVLGDTLVKDFTPAEVEAVLAHELGHYKMNHIAMSLALQSVVSAAGFWLLERVSDSIARTAGADSITDPAAYPALFLILTWAGWLAMPFQNAFSRRLEIQADEFALKSTRSNADFVSAMQKLGATNLADTDPHPLIKWIFYTHPPLAERIQRGSDYKN